MAVSGGQPAARLGRATLGSVPAQFQPLVAPGAVGAGIVHLGLGAFHRAHQAVYTEEAIDAGGGDWGIVAVAPRSRDVYDAVVEQDLLFSVTTLNDDGSQTRVCGAFAGARHAASDPLAIVALLADPAIRMVTLTVTEKAYSIDPASGTLRLDPALRADLTGDAPPTTIPGLLLRGLRARARADAGPFAVVSCDNLPANGARVRRLVEQALPVTGADPAVQSWIRDQVTFPGTMVDRIVPATTPALLDSVRGALGVTDLAAVGAEPFRQWVIEDAFPGGRPAWELAGATMTSDAGPYERLKLRMLNGVHSALAYLGALQGIETIAEALTRPHLREFAERLITTDILPTIDPPDGVDPAEYGCTVLARFDNSAVRHRTLQIAMDGSQKLPQRILHTIADRRAAGAMPRYGALVVAAWMRFAMGAADDGRALPLDDPLTDEIRAAVAGAGGSPAAVVDALLGLSAVFPAELAQDDAFRAVVVEWLDALSRHGVATTLGGSA
ncbi:MAG TPA: mannitol dehydrogenase family protein [Micromonosporaceae bacterium]|nr:mannitol dehydrogenase family protein [Micromonosporaceae bacterium]